MNADVTIRSAGSAAVMIDCGDLEGALKVFAALAIAREQDELEVEALIPAAETVLVVGGEARNPGKLVPKLRRLIEARSDAGGQEISIPKTVIPVFYTGEDLEEVAQLTKMSVQQVIERHTSVDYTVAFTGFAPGFAYLSGGDPALQVPRRATPRPRILPGSVGLAGPFSGVYPRESPGGWQIIGLTEHKMWDTDREQPAALLAGGKVRFVPERERVVGSGSLGGTEPVVDGSDSTDVAASAAADADSVAETQLASTGLRPSLRVIEPGLQSLIEDVGRPGVTGMGVGESGAADRSAYRSVNRLVGNRPDAAAIEFGHGGFSVEAIETTVLALAGAERSGKITGPLGSRKAPYTTPFRLSAGERLVLGEPTRGLRTVLGVRGGILAPKVLGSRSRDALAKLGPEPLVAGQELVVSDEALRVVGTPEPFSSDLFPAVGEETTLRIVLGPRDYWFDGEGLETLSGESWEVTPRSDRVGVRLAGKPLTRASEYVGRELPSEGIALGAIQVPPDGQPVLFLVDRPLTGGYPVVAVVHSDDIDLAAQLAPGCRVRFVPISEDQSDDVGQPTPSTIDQEKRP